MVPAVKQGGRTVHEDSGACSQARWKDCTRRQWCLQSSKVEGLYTKTVVPAVKQGGRTVHEDSGACSQTRWKDCTRRQWCLQSSKVEGLYTKTVVPVVKQGGRTVHEDSGACRVTTRSLTLSVEAIPPAVQLVAHQSDTGYTCLPSHRLSEPAAKGGAWDELPQLSHSHVVFGCRDYCGSAAVVKSESEGMGGQVD